jgi:plastocyanin
MRLGSLAPALAILTVVLVGCSSAASQAVPTAATASAAAAQTAVTVKDFTLDPKGLTLPEQSALAVTNAGPTVHNVTIRDGSGTVLAATTDLRQGQSEVLPLPLPTGTYTLFCSLPGHESLGIKGTLTVSK